MKISIAWKLVTSVRNECIGEKNFSLPSVRRVSHWEETWTRGTWSRSLANWCRPSTIRSDRESYPIHPCTCRNLSDEFYRRESAGTRRTVANSRGYPISLPPCTDSLERKEPRLSAPILWTPDPASEARPGCQVIGPTLTVDSHSPLCLNYAPLPLDCTCEKREWKIISNTKTMDLYFQKEEISEGDLPDLKFYFCFFKFYRIFIICIIFLIIDKSLLWKKM